MPGDDFDKFLADIKDLPDAQPVAAPQAQAPAAAPALPKYAYTSPIPELPDIIKQRLAKSERPEPAPPKPWADVAGDALSAVPGWLKKQGKGFAYGAQQGATLGFGDEVAGTLSGGGDAARAAARQEAGDAMRDAPLGATLGAIAGGAPYAAMTGGLSIPAQVAATAGFLGTELMGQGEGSAGERVNQAAGWVGEHPLATGAALLAPAAAEAAGPVMRRAGDAVQGFRHDMLSNLLMKPDEKAALKFVKGHDAPQKFAADVERAGLFKGSNPVSDALLPATPGRVAKNARALSEKAGPAIDKNTDVLIDAANRDPDKFQRVDYGPMLDRMEELKSHLSPSVTSKSGGEQRTIQREIDFAKDKTDRSQRVAAERAAPKGPKAKSGKYEPPTEPKPEAPGEVEASAERVYPSPEYEQPPVAAQAHDVTPGEVLRSGPERLAAGQKPDNAQPGFMRFPNKALPEHTAAPLPDEMLASPAGPHDVPPMPIDQWSREFYERAGGQPKSPLANRGSSELAPQAGSPPPGDALALRAPEGGTDLAKPGSSLARRDVPLADRAPDAAPKTPREPDVQDADWSEYDPITPPAPQAKRLPQGAPKHTVSLPESLAAQRDMGSRTNFDPQTKPTTAIDKALNMVRWQELKDANREAISGMANQQPELRPNVDALNDANQQFHIAKTVELPALRLAERAGAHAIHPRDLMYGALSGHGGVTLASRLGRTLVPGTVAKLAKPAESGAFGLGRIADVLAGKQGGAVGATGAARNVGPALVMQNRVGQDAGMLEKATGEAEKFGANVYDKFFGATPRENRSERNKRMSESIRKRLQKSE